MIVEVCAYVGAASGLLALVVEVRRALPRRAPKVCRFCQRNRPMRGKQSCEACLGWLAADPIGTPDWPKEE